MQINRVSFYKNYKTSFFGKSEKTSVQNPDENKMVYKPWGYYENLKRGDGFLTKLIHVAPHQQLSYQMHNFRSEHWIVLSGTANVLLDDNSYFLAPGQSIDIPLKAKHSLQNPFSKDLEIIEVQMGDKLSEDDIIRFKDMYGRESK